VFLRNETRAKSGFVSYVSISLCFDFDPNPYPLVDGSESQRVMSIEVRPGRGRCFIASRAYAVGEEVLREVILLDRFFRVPCI